MVSLWNLNIGVAVLLLVVGTGCVLGDNNYNGNAREHHNSRVRPGGFCEDLSPQNFIEMDHVRTSHWNWEFGNGGWVVCNLGIITIQDHHIVMVPVNWKCAMFVNKRGLLIMGTCPLGRNVHADDDDGGRNLPLNNNNYNGGKGDSL